MTHDICSSILTRGRGVSANIAALVILHNGKGFKIKVAKDK